MELHHKHTIHYTYYKGVQKAATHLKLIFKSDLFLRAHDHSNRLIGVVLDVVTEVNRRVQAPHNGSHIIWEIAVVHKVAEHGNGLSNRHHGATGSDQNTEVASSASTRFMATNITLFSNLFLTYDGK